MRMESFCFLYGEKTPHGYKAIIEIRTSKNVIQPIELYFDENGNSNYEALDRYEHTDREFLEDLIYYAVFKKYLELLKSNEYSHSFKLAYLT